MKLKPIQDRESSSEILEDWRQGLPFQGRYGVVTIKDRDKLYNDGCKHIHVTFANNCRVTTICL